MGIVALIARCLFDREAAMVGAELGAVRVAAATGRGRAGQSQRRKVPRVRIVTADALPAAERRVLDVAPLPGSDLLVAGGADLDACRDEQAVVLAGVRIVAGAAAALGHGRMNVRPRQGFGHLAMAAAAEYRRPIAQQRAHPSRVRVVAGGALGGLDRRMLNPRLEGEIVTAQAGLPLVDGVRRR